METNQSNTGGFSTTNYTLKPSKADIIQRLLEQGHIDVSEAMTLMMTEIVPIQQFNPYQPPFNPTVTYSQPHGNETK
jgi:hypothetical protein